jgi:hypothetical protein
LKSRPEQVSAGQLDVPHDVVSGAGVSVQLDVPLQVRVMQVSDVQVIGVPWHVPPEQASPQVQAFESSQAALVRQAQVPPALVQRQVVPPQLTVAQEFPAPQVWVVPMHVPVAPAVPHPLHDCPTTNAAAPQVSAHVPAEVAHPPAGEHSAWQQPPAVHGTTSGVHEQALQVPVPLQYRVQLVP